MKSRSARGGIRGRRVAVLAACFGAIGLGTLLGPADAPVSADAQLALEQTMPGDTLVGRPTPVTLTVTNSGDTTAYDLALLVRLPLGVHVSSSDEPATATSTELDAGGNPVDTVVTWENIVDVRPGVEFHFRYSLSYDLGTGPDQWSVSSDPVPVHAEAFASDVDATPPTFVPPLPNPPGNGRTVTIVPAGLPTAVADETTELVPVLITKSEPSIEGELLRGVHDHQTIYSVTVEAGSEGAVSFGQVDDWIPAGLEFLGCGDVDHSSTEEYPGSGPLNPGNAPALPSPSNCFEPTSIETVDSGIPADLAPGVYTHVVWDALAATLAPNAKFTVNYVAGVPQFENSMTWDGGAAPTPASLRQGANLDNNHGPQTTQVGPGNTYTNLVQAETTFDGVDKLVDATETVQAVDLSIHKFVDNPTIEEGAISTWTLLLETSEYVVEGGVVGLSLHDTTPDGTCPIDSTTPVSPALACTSITSPPPSTPYSTYVHHPDGTTDLTWDLSAETMGRSETRVVSFSTVALTAYSNGLPVSSNDQWTNSVVMPDPASGPITVTTFEELGPDEPSGYVPNEVTDDSSAGQSGTPVTFSKDVGRPATGAADCGDGTDATWDPDSIDAIGPGDRVCFRLTVEPPDSLDTIETTLVDFLPPGFRYETGAPGPDNEVDPALVAGGGAAVSGSPETGQRVQWTLVPTTNLEPSQVAQVVFSAVLDTAVAPDLGTSGDTFVNRARISWENTNGEIFVQPDDAAVEFAEAHLTLTKGITQVTGPVSPGDDRTFPLPGADNVTGIEGGANVTYTISVHNDGSRDAFDVEVRDLLPINNDGFTDQNAECSDPLTFPAPITGAVACTGDDLVWTGLSIPAGASLDLTYTWTVGEGTPLTVPVSTSWTNEAGVVRYSSATNQAAPSDVYVYVPRDNIAVPPGLTPNTDPARDDAHLSSPGITMTKTRTTSIGPSTIPAQPGNAAADQATIGETIHFTVEARQAAGTQAQNYVLTDDLTNRGMTYVSGTAVYRSGSGATGAPCGAYSAPIPPAPGGPLNVTGQVITLTQPGPLAPTGADLCIELTFDATVDDVPTGTAALNKRPGLVHNEAVLTFNAQGGEPRTLRASVDTRIVEPNLTLSKSSDATIDVFPGDSVTYTIQVTNVSGTQVSTANDVSVTDVLDTDVDVVTDPGGGTVTPGPPTTIAWTIPTLAPGASTTLTYTVRLHSPLVADATIDNTATVRGTSLPGADPLERRSDATPAANSPCSPAACPGYFADDQVTLDIAGPAITKTALRPLNTVGSDTDFQIVAEFPPNLDYGPTTITDDLAGGATIWLEDLSASCTGCSQSELDAYVGNAGSADPATDPEWFLGDLGPSSSARTVVITYRARVLKHDTTGPPPTLDPVRGDTLENTATLTFDNGTVDDTATITIAEPHISMVKSVATTLEPTPRVTSAASPAQAAPGSNVAYTLAITNDGNWTAYDVDVVDEPDSVVTAGCTDTPRLTAVDSVPVLGVVPDLTLGTGDSCVDFAIASILPGQTITITYRLAIPTDFDRSDFLTPNGVDFVNVATIPSYYALAPGDRVGNTDGRQYGPVATSGFVDLAASGIGDRVFFDVNGNGVDNAEPGIPGVGLQVTWAGTDTLLDTPDDVVRTVTTDADGYWLDLDGTTTDHWIPSGHYRIAVVTPPAGLALTSDPTGPLAPLSPIALTTLDENERDLTQDFGYTGTGSIGDLLWLDLDADGVADAGEPGIPNIPVTVVWGGFDNDLTTTTDNVTYPATTNGSGIYGVTRLPGGNYSVTVNTTSPPFPTGLTPTYDLDGIATAHTALRTLTVTGGIAQNATDVDFGYTGTGSIGDLLWLDLDADGVADAGEPGIPNIPVTVVWGGFDNDLTTTTDNVTYPATTNGSGIYGVGNLPGGNYSVTVNTTSPPFPTGLTPTYDLDGIATAHTALRTLTVTGGIAQNATDVDFGYTGTGSIGDLLWLDLDADGVADAGEPGIPNIPVTVVWGGFDNNLTTTTDNVTYPATTNGSGIYGVGNLPGGNYSVTVNTTSPPFPTGLTPTYDLDGIATAHTALRTLTVTGGIAQNATDVDFGYTGTGSIGDLLWLDLDADGVADAGEPGIPNIPVTVVWGGFDNNLTTTTDNVTYPATTNGSGIYGVGNLPGGNYSVTVNTTSPPFPTGLTPTYDLDGIATAHTALRTLTVTGGTTENATDVDFGYAGKQSVGDLVWLDRNADGLVGPGAEPGIPGIPVALVWEGFDGALGGGDDVSFPGVTTDSDGMYLFEHVPAGDVRVTTTPFPSLDPTFDHDDPAPPPPPPSVITLTTPNTAVRNIADDAAPRDVDFGYRGNLTVGDLVWLDVNGNGIGPDTPGATGSDLTEPGIPGQPVEVRHAGADGVLRDADDIVFDTTVTDADGRWMIDQLPAGDISVSLPDGVLQPIHGLAVTSAPTGATLPDQLSVDRAIAAGNTNPDLTFDWGLTGNGSIGDFVWLDFNGDNMPTVGEPGLPNVKMIVEWAGFDGDFGSPSSPLAMLDNVTYTTTTDTVTDATHTIGQYSVGLLPPGPFRVTADRQPILNPLLIPLTPTYDLDGGSDETARRDLAPAEHATDVDFAYIGHGVAGDFVWWDLDGAGDQDPGEPGFPNVDITLTWAGFDNSFGTADDGTLAMPTDANGNYLFQRLPDGFFRVAVDQADLPAGLTATAFPPLGDGSGAPFTLLVNDDKRTLDFGYVGPYTIGDLVWSDVNRDGSRQTSEPAIGDAGLTVTYLGADGTAGGGDDITFDTTTAPLLLRDLIVGAPAAPADGVRVASDLVTVVAGLGGDPLAGDPLYAATGLVDGRYTVDLHPATLPAGYTPLSDRDGGDPASTALTIAGASIPDADFGVFINVPPDPGSGATLGNVACGSQVTVDPAANVTDVNGDTLTVVPGSISAPAGVTVTIRSDGLLQVSTASSVNAPYTLTWRVSDGRGGVASVSLTVQVNCFAPNVTANCTSNTASISWALSNPGGTVTGPVTIYWYDPDGRYVATTSGQPVAGTAPFPPTLVGSPSAGVTFGTTDGALVGPTSVPNVCTALPATGTDTRELLALAGIVLGAGLLLFSTSRRRRTRTS